MVLQAFRARDDVTLKRGSVYTLDTATGEIFSMTRLASDPQPAPPPPWRPDPPSPPTPQEVPVPAATAPGWSGSAGGAKKQIHRTKEEILRSSAIALWYLCDNPGKSVSEIRAAIGSSLDTNTLRGDLSALEKAGLASSERKPAAFGTFTPTGMTVFWSVTEAGRAEARRLRAANSNGSTVRDLPHEGAPPDFPGPRS